MNEALLRHFRDLRDGIHGEAVSREDKERLFVTATELLDPVARRALSELDADLLLGTGSVVASGVTRSREGGLNAMWSLTWPEQRASHVQPIAVVAHYGCDFHHPHLRGNTVGDWPLNVFTPADAEAQLDTLRVIAAADAHNLVFQETYALMPALTVA
ncbi:hypothetical protein FH608_001270 [Nonomuraea phyllanthi]|uniref:Uncharacterized protein n=1 Tax=Nonomuraea phyllanthi TaxID=2219224 RepID=A0A5C4WWL5_9ACTN|nr:hypothetical protein [Nonomuraea phyllanthi]KAB8197225.1 hypothetical protein FH608_001270 [Nonomuraea phyllanthi]QFY06777.1 hypothetical protein GBF35_08800 [Nonomuraea phyllanthi]